jgi:hypothetical protein
VQESPQALLAKELVQKDAAAEYKVRQSRPRFGRIGVLATKDNAARAAIAAARCGRPTAAGSVVVGTGLLLRPRRLAPITGTAMKEEQLRRADRGGARGSLATASSAWKR